MIWNGNYHFQGFEESQKNSSKHAEDFFIITFFDHGACLKILSPLKQESG